MFILSRGLRHLSRVSDVLFRRTLLEREITIFPDDVFLTCYPRSGNTWVRFLIGNLIQQDQPADFMNLEKLVPDMYRTADWVLRRLPRPRILKSHECFDARYKKVIYIVRDARDVAVSNYHQELKLGSIPEGYPIELFVPRWMEGQFWARIGSWADHVLSWLSTRRGRDGFLLLRYEDLQKDPKAELARVAAFLSRSPTPEVLAKAVEMSSAERMRALEAGQGSRWVSTYRTRQDQPFVRTATAGGWRSTLPAGSVASIEAKWGAVIESLGYELSPRPSSLP
jgi:hypothetical protein